MKLVLYPGKEEEKTEYFRELFDSENIEYSEDSGFLGKCFVIYPIKDDIPVIADYISVYILEFYLKEYVLTKIYDEYEMMDVSSGCEVLLGLSREIGTSDVGKNIEKFLNKNSLICIDNYVLFNLKSIMTTVYFLTDCLCEKILYQKCRADFLSLVQSYRKLKFDNETMSDAEFASEVFFDSPDNSDDYNNLFF